MKNYLTAAVLLVAAAGLPADEGRIPIFSPTTIAAPGSYVVTRDIASTTTILNIQAEGVDVDLNGFTLSVDNAAEDVIVLGSPAGGPTTGVRIHGGTVDGGFAGIFCFSPGGSGRRLRVHDMLFRNSADPAILCSSLREARIERIEVDGTSSHGISLNGGSGFRATIADNVIRGTVRSGIALSGASGGIVRDNRIHDFGSGGIVGDAGILLFGDGSAGDVAGNRVSGNVIERGLGLADGMRLIEDDGSLIDGNVVSGVTQYGIFVTGDNYRMTDNLVDRAGRTGILAGGNYGYLERNSSQRNGEFGLSCPSILYYRGNMLAGNALGAVDNGPGVCEFASDLGENVP